MRVEYHNSFERDIRRIKDRAILGRVKAVIIELESIEALEGYSNVKAMKGYPGYFRIRIGDYRLGLKQTEIGVRLIRFLSRGEIYRKFP